ncbi:MAG: hypothetical protein P1U56_13945 [Saprospiraceae bacterium]|nr:hypothetical protein [Saprospiraceae bacterium]
MITQLICRNKSGFWAVMLLCASALQSCNSTIYSAFNSSPFGPGMMKPLNATHSDNALPKYPNFVQGYQQYSKTKANSRFGALIRIIEFEYDIQDSFHIIPRITTGYDEGQMTGLMTIVLDQYELVYENPAPKVRAYVEEVSFESNRSMRESQKTYSPIRAGTVVTPQGQHTTVIQPTPLSIAQNSVSGKGEQVMNRSQLYNSAKFSLEQEDVYLFHRSKSLYYKIHLEHCDILVFPSKEQIKILKGMLASHYQKE